MLAPCGGGLGLGGNLGSFFFDMGVILSAGTECKDSIRDRLWDRILGHSPLCLRCLAVGGDLQADSKTAGTL